MIGLNTRADRESTVGYRDNYVKCKCSEKTEKKIVHSLGKIGAINITVGKCISVYLCKQLMNLIQHYRTGDTKRILL